MRVMRACLALLLVACSSKSPEPPIVASGVPGQHLGGPTTPDASADAEATPVVATRADGGGQEVTCSYVAAGSEGVFCAIELGVPAAEVAAYEAACASASFDGTPGTTCSPDSLTGCCRLASGLTASFASPTWACYYPGDSDDASTCTAAGGEWSGAQP